MVLTLSSVEPNGMSPANKTEPIIHQSLTIILILCTVCGSKEDGMLFMCSLQSNWCNLQRLKRRKSMWFTCFWLDELWKKLWNTFDLLFGLFVCWFESFYIFNWIELDWIGFDYRNWTWTWTQFNDKTEDVDKICAKLLLNRYSSWWIQFIFYSWWLKVTLIFSNKQGKLLFLMKKILKKTSPVLMLTTNQNLRNRAHTDLYFSVHCGNLFHLSI